MSVDVIIYGLLSLLTLMIGGAFWYLFYIILRVPEDAHATIDEPPILYKLFKLPIRVLAFYLKPLLGPQTLEKYERMIVYAGLEYQFKAEHIIAGKIVGAVGLGLIFAIGLLFAGQSWWLCLVAALIGYYYPDIWLKDTKVKRNSQISKTMPFFLDMMTLSIESGLNLNGALKQAVQKGPKGVVRTELEKVLRDIKTGISRSEAIRKMGARIDDQSIKSLTSSIIQAERMGMNLGPILRAQAEQRRTERFLRAEKLAMEAPVKLLFPLVVFIFPCTFVVIGFPIYVMVKEAFV